MDYLAPYEGKLKLKAIFKNNVAIFWVLASQQFLLKTELHPLK